MKALNGVWAAALYLASLAPADAAAPAGCTNEKGLGVSRTVEINTTGGPGFGFEHYKANDFLQDKEVVLTFDDGPQKYSTEEILEVLDKDCVKATFFSIGKMALGYPQIIREVAKRGHTVGTHTWSHQNIRKMKTFEDGKDEIERGASAVSRAVGQPIAPFFRFPTLQDTPEAIAHLGKRNIAMFSTDIDSFDFKIQSAENIVKTVMRKLEKNGKGIVLMHDIHKTTAKAVPLLLAELKAKGFKIVHLTAKAEMKTLAEFDQLIEKDAKGLPAAGSDRPISSIVRTVEGAPPPNEKANKAAAPAPEAAPEAGDDATSDIGAPAGEQAEPAMETTAVVQEPVSSQNAPDVTASGPKSKDTGTAETAGVGSSDDESGKTGKTFMQRVSDAWNAFFAE